MSTGIGIYSEPDKDIGGYLQNFAGEFEGINYLLEKDGCDLSPYLYCPESWQDEEEMKEFGASDEEIAYTKQITADDYHPIDEVFEKLVKARALVAGYDEDQFDYGKAPFIEDLDEAIESLKPHQGSGLKIQLLRG